MSEARYDVVGIGSAIVDIMARCDDAFLERHDLAKGTMRLIDAAQADALYRLMGPAVEISGGSIPNTCAGLASLGARAAFIGRVADDQFGQVFAHDVRAVGVAFHTGPVREGAPTARCLILVTPDGERTMNTFLGAAAELSPEDIDAEMIAAAAILYLEGYSFDPPKAREAFTQAAAIAADAGTTVALSLSDPFCVDRHRAAFLDFIGSRVDLLFANEKELLSLYETQSLDEACARLRGVCRLAAVTRSEKGSLIVSPERIIPIAAEPVARVLDTTGAGDLYAAGFLAGYARGRDLERCGRLASLAASEVISHLGARPETALADLARTRGLM